MGNGNKIKVVQLQVVKWVESGILDILQRMIQELVVLIFLENVIDMM